MDDPLMGACLHKNFGRQSGAAERNSTLQGYCINLPHQLAHSPASKLRSFILYQWTSTSKYCIYFWKKINEKDLEYFGSEVTILYSFSWLRNGIEYPNNTPLWSVDSLNRMQDVTHDGLHPYCNFCSENLLAWGS